MEENQQLQSNSQTYWMETSTQQSTNSTNRRNDASTGFAKPTLNNPLILQMTKMMHLHDLQYFSLCPTDQKNFQYRIVDALTIFCKYRHSSN